MKGVVINNTLNNKKPSKKTPVNLLIGSLPKKTFYKDGEKLDLTGIEICVVYTDNTIKNVTSNINTIPQDNTILNKIGENNIEISYTENNTTVTTSFQIYVEIVVVTWSDGTDEQIVKMVEAADNGLINLHDYWSVGQERKITLGAMPAPTDKYDTTDTYETHEPETLSFVLMNAGGKELVNPTSSGRTECSFIVGQKEVLTNYGSIDQHERQWVARDNAGFICVRYKWCNDQYYKAIPSTLRPLFKQHKNYNYQYNLTNYTVSKTYVTETKDYFTLPEPNNIFDNNDTKLNESQFTWYKTEANRYKYKLDGTLAQYFTRRNTHAYNSYFRHYAVYQETYTDDSGYQRTRPSTKISTSTLGLAPYGVI